MNALEVYASYHKLIEMTSDTDSLTEIGLQVAGDSRVSRPVRILLYGMAFGKAMIPLDLTMEIADTVHNIKGAAR